MMVPYYSGKALKWLMERCTRCWWHLWICSDMVFRQFLGTGLSTIGGPFQSCVPTVC